MTLGRVTFRGANTAGDASGLTLTVTASPHAATKAGDTLLAIWTMAQSQLAAALTTFASNGWTALGSSSQGTTVGSIVGWRKAGSSDDGGGSSYNFSVSSNFRQSAVLASYGAIDPTSLAVAPLVETTSGTSHNTPAGSVVAGRGGLVVMTAISERNNSPQNIGWVPPSGYVLRGDAEYGGSNATTSTALADNLTPLSTLSSYGGAPWTNGRTAETSVVTWIITALPASGENMGVPILSPVT